MELTTNFYELTFDEMENVDGGSKAAAQVILI